MFDCQNMFSTRRCWRISCSDHAEIYILNYFSHAKLTPSTRRFEHEHDALRYLRSSQ